MNIKTLQYWHKLEFFYPYVVSAQNSDKIKSYYIGDDDNFRSDIGSGRAVSGLKYMGAFPDYDNPDCGEREKVRYYEVYLGMFSVDSALEALEGELGKMKFRDAASEEKSCLCAFSLDKSGKFISDRFKLSAFPWAIHRIRDGKIIVDNWDEDFNRFEKELYLSLYNCGDAPMTYEKMSEFRAFIEHKLNWNIKFDTNWLRIDMVKGELGKDGELTRETREEEADIDEQIKKNELLNSFYIRDLEKIIGENDDNSGNSDKGVGKASAFEKYIAHSISENSVDIEHSPKEAYKLMSPARLPKGK